MQQVLFRIPLKADWLPVPLWVVLLIVFLALAAALYGGARYAARWKLDPKNIQGAAVWVAVGGLIIAGLAYGFADSGLPIYGFGMMLFLAFVVCNWIGARLAAKEGLPREIIQDVAIWVIIGGLIGARLTSFISVWISSGQHPADLFDFVRQFVSIWDGGIVLYGAVIGGVASYALAYYLVFRKQKVSTLKLADVIAPCLAIGLCLGRIGCFLNGCCYGQVACVGCPAVGVSFPLSAPPRYELVKNGYQTAAGFTFHDGGGALVEKVEPNSVAAKAGLVKGDVIVKVEDAPVWTRDDFLRYVNDPPMWKNGKDDLIIEYLGMDGRRRQGALPWTPDKAAPPLALSPIPAPASPIVDHVDPNSAAARAGLRAGDAILAVDDKAVHEAADLEAYVSNSGAWPRGKNDLTLTVLHEGAADSQQMHLWPWTIRLHPTQLYETVSMFLLFWVLTFYRPFRRHDGQVMALMMVGYGAHRYINELLRADERPGPFETWTSVLVFIAGIALWVWLSRRPAQYFLPTATSGLAPAAANGASSTGIRSGGSSAVSPAHAAATATSAIRPGPRRRDR
ncbi:MAG TPA: prolipoprotein diacylglyceryl transferase family protein [Gemmataceae bacterium]|nr:prolipoprotein diacylglyceryl transferase family protein [Gemmataceae bacterium]